MGINIRQLSYLIGAEVTGLDLKQKQNRGNDYHRIAHWYLMTKL